MNFFKGLGEKIETGFEIAQNQGRQLIHKVQGVEGSKDERFDESKKLFEKHLETVEKMLQSVKMQDNGLQALGNGLASMSKYIVSFNGDDNKVPGSGMAIFFLLLRKVDSLSYTLYPLLQLTLRLPVKV